jgi:hypothetical protein
LVITTLQMVTMSGRMVPAMALINRCAAPGQRGGFMSLNTAVQHLSAGLATAAAGLLVTQPAAGQPLEGYPLVGLLSCLATVACLLLAGLLRPAPLGELAPDSVAEPAPTSPLTASPLTASPLTAGEADLPELSEAETDEDDAVRRLPAFEDG